MCFFNAPFIPPTDASANVSHVALGSTFQDIVSICASVVISVCFYETHIKNVDISELHHKSANCSK